MRAYDAAAGRKGLPMSPLEMDEFVKLLADGVADRLAEMPLLVNKDKLAQLFAVSVATIGRLKAAGKLPTVRVGRRVLFDPAACIAALSSNNEEGAS